MAAKKSRPRRIPQGKGPHKGPHLDTEARIAEIVRLRLEGNFRFGKTLPELAERWGVTYQYARELSAQATRQIVKDRSRADVRSYVHLALERVVEEAFGAGDLKAVNQAVKLLIELRGLAAPKKTELTGKGGGPVELDVEMNGALDRIARRIDRLAAAGRAPGPPEGAGADPG